MLRFNLLPQAFQERLLFAQKIRRASTSIKIFFGLLATLSLFLIFTLVYLQKQDALFSEELALIKGTQQNTTIIKIQRDIEHFNNEVKRLFSAPPSSNWSSILIELSTITPQGMSFDSLSLEGKGRSEQVNLRGKARRREDIIQFEKALRQSVFFSKIVSPLSNYQRAENVTFQLSFTLKPLN